MRRRLLSHIAVAALLLPAFIEPPRVVEVVQAAPEPTHRIVSLLPPSPTMTLPIPRDQLSTRAPLPPLPTPVPIDPDATPIPGPTAAPVRTNVVRLIWPVAGTLTTLYSAGHPAIDVAAACGTPVVAAASGTIVYAGWKTNGGGYVLDLDVGWGLVSLNHLSGFAVTGGSVNQGQVVAYVGSTGNSRGCHVHFALMVNGAWVNPLGYL